MSGGRNGKPFHYPERAGARPFPGAPVNVFGGRRLAAPSSAPHFAPVANSASLRAEDEADRGLTPRSPFSGHLRLAVRRVRIIVFPMSDFVSGSAVSDARQVLDRIRTNMRVSIKGKDDVINQVLVCLVAGGHLLLEDLPGVGKTTLAYSLARSTDCAFARIQFMT